MSYVVQRAIAALLLVAATPLMGVIAGAIRALDGSPVLFRQIRVGRHGARFEILKFRTMVPDADRLLLEDPTRDRLTRTGPLLRKTGLDELPQLINVLRGDMTIVGPRALLPEVADAVPERFHLRYNALPGLTGLAQVSGRNTLPWSKRLTLDVEYVRKRTTRADLAIALRTVHVLLRGEGHVPDRNTGDVDDLGLLGERPE